jgi:hypothetical protein
MMSVAKILGGLTSLTQLVLNMSWWYFLSDRSGVSIFTSLSQSTTLEFVDLCVAVNQ